MDILTLLYLFIVKHFYADFIMQTYEQTIRKGIYGDWVGITHSLDHVWTTIIVLAIFNIIHSIQIVLILPVALIEGIVHYHIDWIKVKFGCKDSNNPTFWAQLGLDQLAHHFCYLLIAGFFLV